MNHLKNFILNNKFANLTQAFIEKQSWEALRENELTVTYEDLINLTNNIDENNELEIISVEYLENRKINIVATYENKIYIALDITIYSFEVSPKKAYFTFLPEVKTIKALKKSGLLNHIKLFVANIFATNFNETILNKVFKDKSLGNGIYSYVSSNKIRIDFLEAIKATELGKTYLGFSALDFFQITNIRPKNDGLGIQFNIHIPEWIKTYVFLTFSSLINKIISFVFKSRK